MNKIQNPKFIIFFAVITVTIFAFFLPQAISAQAGGGQALPQGAYIPQAAAPAGNTDTSSNGKGWSDTQDREAIWNLFAKNSLGNVTIGLTTFLTKGIAYLIVLVTFKLAAFANLILSYILAEIVSKAITTDPDFTDAWIQLRNLGNMLIVLGFIVVGVATALRIREYEAKKLMFPLVAVALLINFSGLLCGMIIDAANLLTSGLVNSGSVAGMPQNILSKIYEQAVKRIIDSDTNVVTFLSQCASFAFIFAGIAITFLYMAAIFLARYAVLIMLYILSPLAFAFWVFPASKKLWSEWWSNFVKWAFVGIYGTFGLWMATVMLHKDISGINGGTTGSEIDFLELLIKTIIILMFLFVAFNMSMKVSGAAVTALGGLALGTLGLAAKGLGTGLKVAGNLSGASRLAAGMRNGMGRALENVGLRQKGTTAGEEARELAEKESALNNLGSERLAQMVNRPTYTYGSIRNRAAAIKLLAKRNDLNQLGSDAKQNEALDIANAYQRNKGIVAKGGVDEAMMKQAVEQNYRLAGPAGSIKRQTQLSDNLAKGMSASAMGRIEGSDLTYDHIKEMSPSTALKFRANSNTALKRKVRQYASQADSDSRTARLAGEKSKASKFADLAAALRRVT